MKPSRSLRRAFPDVVSVTDATRPIHVSVSASDCKEGEKLSATNCALAKATKRKFKASGAIIGLAYSYIVRGKKALRFKTPETVAREITSFDRHHDFAPGEYGLSPVSPSSRLGKQKNPGGRKPNRTGRKAQIVHKKTVGVREMK